MTNETIITKVEFFSTSYQPMRANVAARNFSSLTYRTKGRITVDTESVSLVSDENTLTFIPCGCRYSTEILEDGEMMILHYQIADGAEDFFDEPTLITPVHEDTFLNLFSRAMKHSTAGNRSACMADAYRLFAEIEKELLQKKAQPSPRLRMVKQYMDDNITDCELSVNTFAEMHKTSEAYFRREFKKYYSETPIEYIKRRRIEIACHLLRTELYSISDVATRAGFGSISYFSAEFRKTIGCSPKEYRDM